MATFPVFYSILECSLVHDQVWTAGSNGLNEWICCLETSTILEVNCNQSNLTLQEEEEEEEEGDRCGVRGGWCVPGSGDIWLQHTQHTTHLQQGTGADTFALSDLRETDPLHIVPT